MCRALCLAVADGNVASNLLALAEHVCSRYLRVVYSNPAGVKPEHLGHQNQVFAEVSHTLVEVVSLLSGNNKIVAHATKAAIFGQRSEKSLWLVSDQLDVQTALAVDYVYLMLKHLYNIF